MKNNYIKLTLNSISVKLFLLIIITIIPLMGLLINNNIQSRNTLLEQINNTHSNMLQSYTIQIDNQLSTAMAYIINIINYENDPQIIALSQDEAAVQYAKLSMVYDMSEKLLNNNYVDGYFVQIREQSGYVNFINSFNRNYHNSNSVFLQAYVEDCIKNGYYNSQWQLCTINNEDYLFLLIKGSDNIWSGAYVRYSQLLTHFSPSNVASSQLHLLLDNSLTDYANSLSEDMQLITYPISSANISLAETFYKNEILQSLPFMQKYTALITITLIVLVIVMLVLIHQIVTLPLIRLASAMHHIQHGDLDYRIPDKRTSSEIEMVNQTFNQMVNEVQYLKINIYEEQLKVQKTQLRNLQMQIRPHFLINSLNMIYNLIETNQLKLANKLIQHSIDYFRYMVKVDDDLISLNEEIDHVRNYLEIQSIRYQDNFTYSIEIDSLINDMLVPPIMIQNFVENSVKYALSFTENLDIKIKITSFEKDYFPYAKIVISDTGFGYPSEYLEKLNSGTKIIKKDGLHIGIHSTVQRLKILFGDKAAWRFYNANGAVAEIILPAIFAELNEDISYD